MAGNSRLFDPSGLGQPQTKGHYWRILQPWVYALVGLLFVAVVLALFYPEWKKGQNMKGRLQAMQADIQNQKQELGDLQELSGRLQDDPFTVERMARDTLSVARPGEVIFKFQPYATNVNTPGEAKGLMRQRTARQSP
ncbi:MAG: septum formation initiator family protein [Aliarcobacter sp.]